MIGLGSDKNDIFICKTHSPLTVSTPPSVCSWSHPPPRDLLDNFSGTKRPSLSRSFDWRSQKPSQDMRILLPRLVNNGASSYTFVSWDSPEGIEERRTNTHCCKRQQKCRKVPIKERRQKLFFEELSDNWKWKDLLMWDDVIFSWIIQFGGGIRFGYGIVLLCVLLLRSFDFHMVWPLTQKGDGFLGARPTVAAWTIASFPSKSHSSLAAIPRSAWATEAMRCRLGRGRAGPQCRSHAMPPFSATPHATKGATQNFSRATEISNWATVCIALLDVEKERWIIIMVAIYTKINWSKHVCWE